MKVDRRDFLKLAMVSLAATACGDHSGSGGGGGGGSTVLTATMNNVRSLSTRDGGLDSDPATGGGDTLVTQMQVNSGQVYGSSSGFGTLRFKVNGQHFDTPVNRTPAGPGDRIQWFEGGSTILDFTV